MIQNTTQLIETCEVDFDFSEQRKSLNLQTYTGSIQKDRALLRKLSQEGIKYRYQNLNTQLKQRIEKELELIEKKNLSLIFLSITTLSITPGKEDFTMLVEEAGLTV